MEEVTTDTEIEIKRVKTVSLSLFLWMVGITLLFASSFFRGRTTLSDDLHLASFVFPIWFFLQVCILASALGALRRPVAHWSGRTKLLAGVAAASLISLLQPVLLSLAFTEPGFSALKNDPAQASMLWTSPLAFYVIPAAIVVGAWLRSSGPTSLWVALGFSLIAIGVATMLYLPYMARLWRLHYEPQGAGTVALADHTIPACTASFPEGCEP